MGRDFQTAMKPASQIPSFLDFQGGYLDGHPGIDPLTCSRTSVSVRNLHPIDRQESSRNIAKLEGPDPLSHLVFVVQGDVPDPAEQAA
jgi:hypothetical protein